ncbi:MAG: pilus assembly protein CpaD, partial [Rhizobium sp.]
MSGARSAAMAGNRDQAMAHMIATTPRFGISKALFAMAAMSMTV